MRRISVGLGILAFAVACGSSGSGGTTGGDPDAGGSPDSGSSGTTSSSGSSGSSSSGNNGDAAPPRDGASPSAYPIEHVIVIVKENHTFDNYFGTFPGAEG